MFEHAQRCVEKGDHDYANQLFSQCVVEDPGNLVFLQHFFGNLVQKHSENRNASRFTGLKLKSHRTAIAKSASKGDWASALQSACTALALHPWDIPTLLALADAYGSLQSNECQLLVLRQALDADAKHVEVNRRAAATLQQLGQFDQAIACWRRVAQAMPEDDEARQAISRLSVEKTILEGGYDADREKTTMAELSRDGSALADDPALSPEQRCLALIEAEPTVAEHYLRLADVYLHEQQFDDAEQWLARGQQAAGAGDLTIRERLEDVQLRRASHQLAVAQQRADAEPSDANQQLAARLRSQANQVELEIYAARSDRDPQSARLQYEVGLRLKRAGKPKEAIPLLQAARSDPSRLTPALIDLGECFQRIEQYKLALSHYEQAIEACDEPASELGMLARYRAAVLSTGMREFDRAERHLTDLAEIDYGYRDVADRLDNLGQLRDSV